MISETYSDGPSYVAPQVIVGGDWNAWYEDVKVAEYVDVSFTDVYSRYTGLTVYFLQFNTETKEYDIHQLTQEARRCRAFSRAQAL